MAGVSKYKKENEALKQLLLQLIEWVENSGFKAPEVYDEELRYFKEKVEEATNESRL